MSIVVEDDKISIKEEELDPLRTVELKERLLKEGCTSLTLDMWGCQTPVRNRDPDDFKSRQKIR